MAEDLDYIDDYFNQKLGPENALAFEDKIQSDPSFAEQVAFYLATRESIYASVAAERKHRFREIYGNTRPATRLTAIKLVYYIAIAAVVCGLIFGIYLVKKPVSPHQLAESYEVENLQTLAVQMGNSNEDLQAGLQLYNAGKTSESLQVFEKIIRSDTSSFTALKFAGIAALKLKEYEKAIGYFQRLGTFTTLYSNPSLFYQSLTLMERNENGDLEKARKMMQQIVAQDLEGKEIVVKWLQKL
jgi:tetratricopeptide (TPR) repeat protein